MLFLLCSFHRVLTTAQCANSGKTFARVGYKDDDTSTKVAGIQGFHNHPKWSPNHNSMTNDIAIVVLDTFIEETDIPVLNSVPYDLNDLADDELTVIGAGGITALRVVDVQVQDFRQCFDAYRNAKPQVVLKEVRVPVTTSPRSKSKYDTHTSPFFMLGRPLLRRNQRYRCWCMRQWRHGSSSSYGF
jgi:hypothetical protein